MMKLQTLSLARSDVCSSHRLLPATHSVAACALASLASLLILLPTLGLGTLLVLLQELFQPCAQLWPSHP